MDTSKSRIGFAYALPLVLAVAGLAGCAGDAMSLMQGPTGDTITCKVDPWGDIQYQRQVDQCTALYSKAGYKEVK